MKLLPLICVVLSIAILIGFAGCTGEDVAVVTSYAGFSEKTEGFEYDACLIAKKTTDVFHEYWYVYIDSDVSERNGLCGIPVNETTFISHDEDLEQLDDAKPGMMIRFTVPEDYQDLLDPGYFNRTLSIETWGEYREDLYHTGLDCLGELK